MAVKDRKNAFLLKEFSEIFSGSRNNYGHFQYSDEVDTETGKRKGRAWTVKDTLISEDVYRQHLNGELGLGIIPITEENKCNFTVIDVDIYEESLDEYITGIEKSMFPLISFRSKSGGLHIYTFFKQAINVEQALKITNRLASLFALNLLMKKYDKQLEIFPKQYKLRADSKGNWINLPYYDSNETTQFVIRDGKPLDLTDALILIKNSKTTLNKLQDILNDIPYNDGPPCVQSISTIGMDIKQGRNVLLFTTGVYLKKKDESFWEQNLMAFNRGLPNPLPDQELEATVLSSLRRRDYTYKCSEHPCSTFCDKALCKKREFGIGKEGGYFSELEYGLMVRIGTATPYYEWEVKKQGDEKNQKLRFRSEDEIIKQDVFLRLCMRILNFLPTKLKQSEWTNIVNQSLSELRIVSLDPDDDTSPDVMLRMMFDDFLNGRALAATKEQILNKRVWKDDTAYFFRTKDFMDYLFNKRNFRYGHHVDIHGFLSDVGVIRSRIWMGNPKKSVRICKLLAASLQGYDDQEAIKVDFEKLDKEEGEF